MKELFTFCMYGLFSLWILIGLFYGYGSIVNTFDMTCGDNTNLDLLHGLYRYIGIDTFLSYIFVSLTLWFLYKWDFPFIKPISCFIVLFFIYGSFELFWSEIHRYLNNSYGECSSFAPLLKEYGSIVNLFYILPFIFAVIHAVYVGFLYLSFKSLNQK